MSDVAATASVIAQVRAAESAKPPGERLFTDPFARLFAGDERAATIANQYAQVPFFAEQVVVRTRFIDDALCAALGRGVRQVLILGAGFDCRALRMPEVAAAGARVFEVDLRRQIERKRDILRRAGHEPPRWNVYVGCDFAADFEAGLRTDLRPTGYRPDAQTFVIWEGVVNYLDDTAVDRTLRFIASEAAPGSAVVFNYLRLRLLPESLPPRLAQLGFSGVRNWPLVDLYRRYYEREPPVAARAMADEFQIALATL